MSLCLFSFKTGWIYARKKKVFFCRILTVDHRIYYYIVIGYNVYIVYVCYLQHHKFLLRLNEPNYHNSCFVLCIFLSVYKVDSMMSFSIKIRGYISEFGIRCWPNKSAPKRQYLRNLHIDGKRPSVTVRNKILFPFLCFCVKRHAFKAIIFNDVKIR